MSSSSLPISESNKQLLSPKYKKYSYRILCSMQLYGRITSSCHQRCKTSCSCILKAELADRQAEEDLRRCLGEVRSGGCCGGRKKERMEEECEGLAEALKCATATSGM